MQQVKVPARFDAKAFAERYGLDALAGDFHISKGVLYYPDRLPDEPVLEELGDAPPPLDAKSELVRLAELLENKGVLTRGELGAAVRDRMRPPHAGGNQRGG